MGGDAATRLLDPLISLAQGIVSEFGGPGGVPGDLGQTGLAVPFVGADAVTEQVAVIIVGETARRGGGNVDLENVVGTVGVAVEGGDADGVGAFVKRQLGLESVVLNHSGGFVSLADNAD